MPFADQPQQQSWRSHFWQGSDFVNERGLARPGRATQRKETIADKSNEISLRSS